MATAVRPSERVLQTAAMFGLGVDEDRMIKIVPRTNVPLPAGGIVFITGPSGGGKSTVLRAIAEECEAQSLPVVRFDDRQVYDAHDNVPLVDAFDAPLEKVTQLLAMAGLGDAFVMLRSANQLSDGQRYRLKLAQAIFVAEKAERSSIILADEFGATLDRLTAMIIARHLRKWISATEHTLVCATTHDDLLEALEPDVLVNKGLGELIEVVAR